jgi:hypothetical protein
MRVKEWLQYLEADPGTAWVALKLELEAAARAMGSKKGLAGDAWEDLAAGALAHLFEEHAATMRSVRGNPELFSWAWGVLENLRELVPESPAEEVVHAGEEERLDAVRAERFRLHERVRGAREDAERHRHGAEQREVGRGAVLFRRDPAAEEEVAHRRRIGGEPRREAHERGAGDRRTARGRVQRHARAVAVAGGERRPAAEERDRTEKVLHRERRERRDPPRGSADAAEVVAERPESGPRPPPPDRLDDGVLHGPAVEGVRMAHDKRRAPSVQEHALQHRAAGGEGDALLPQAVSAAGTATAGTSSIASISFASSV